MSVVSVRLPYKVDKDRLKHRHRQWRRQPWGSNWESSGISRPHTQKQMQFVLHLCPRSLCALQCFTCVYLHAKTAVDAGDIRS